MDYEYAVIGGDKRQLFLADELISHGHSVICFGCFGSECKADSAGLFEIAACSAPDIICPVPISKDPSVFDSKLTGTDITIRMLVNELRSGQRLIAGRISPQLENSLAAKDVAVYDIMKNESLAIYNSIATAEGAICEAMVKSPLNLCGSRCAVLGYGRCGRSIADRLNGMHCHTDIYSTDEACLAAACSLGYTCMQLSGLEKYAGEYTFIFNTIPSMIITSDIIHKLNKNVTITDIASGGGTDFDSAALAGIKAQLCSGLPGKYSPMSSGIMLARLIEAL